MAKNYLDQAGLVKLLNGLSAKLQANYLGKEATAKAAEKVVNKLTFTVGDEQIVFDGSEAKVASAAAAKVHTHVSGDIADFSAAVREEIFGKDAGDGVVDIHQHANLDELDKVAEGDVAKWNAMIAVGDANRLTYTNANMSGVADVKAALDVLAANVVRTAGLLDLNGKAMQDVEKKADDNAAAIEVLKGDANTAGSVAKAVKDAVDAQAATQLEKDNAQDQAIAAKVAQSAYDTKVKALEDEDARIAGLVATEQGRAEGQEAAIRSEFAAADKILQEAIQDIEENLAKGEVSEAIEAAKDAADAAQADVNALEKYVKGENGANGLEQRIEANEAFVAAQPAIDAEQDRRLGVLEAKFTGGESVDSKIAAAEQAAKDYADQKDTADKQAQQLIDKAQDDRLDAIETAIGEGGALESRVAANEGKLAVIQGADTVAGSIAKAEKDAKAYADAQDAVALQAAKDYADGKITALVNSAPEAMDTLGELAKAIGDHQDVYDAYVDTVTADIAKAKGEAIADAASKDAALKAELQGEIDADVAALGSAIRGEMATETARVNKKIADDIAAESALRQAEEADIRSDFAAADSALSARIAKFEGTGEGSVAAQVKAVQDALDSFEEAQASVDQGQDKKIADLEAKFAGENSVDAKIAAVQAEVDTEEQRAAAAEAALDAKIAAINNKDTGILKQAKDYADAQDAAQYEVIAAEIDADVKKEADRAIEEEGKIRDEFAEADKALHTTISAEIDKDVKVVADELAKQKDASQEGTLAHQIAANAAAIVEIGVPISEDDINKALNDVFGA